MELKNEANEPAPSPRELIIAQLGNWLRFDRNAAGVGQIEQAENVQQRTFASTRRPDNRVDTARLNIE